MTRKQIALLIFLAVGSWIIVPKVASQGQPIFDYTDRSSFIQNVKSCVDYINLKEPSNIPIQLIVGMAGIESGWGTSRFAVEGNALFGVRTWDSDVPSMKPRDNPNAKFGVKKYLTKCDSVQDMIDVINNHYEYEEFRNERQKQLASGKLDWVTLLPYLQAWAENDKYREIISETIIARVIPELANEE
jgi:uncharacterized FlgJ-related protein